MDLDTEVGRSLATHASLCNSLSSNKLSKNVIKCPKTVKNLALKRLKKFLHKRQSFVFCLVKECEIIKVGSLYSKLGFL